MEIKVNNKKLEVMNCNNLFTMCLGLMFQKKKSALFKLAFETKFLASIHTFFMRYNLDIFWLDKEKKVVDARRNVKPYKLSVRPRVKAKYILEVPAGKISLKKGDKVKF